MKEYSIHTEADFYTKISLLDIHDLITSHPPSVLQTYIKLVISQNNNNTLQHELTKPFYRHYHKQESTCTTCLSSQHYIMELLRQNGIDPLEFFTWVLIIMDHHIPKRNTLFLTGPSNTGKTMLANLIIKNFNYAFVTRSGNTNQFYLENCLNRRVLSFEEPLFGSNTIDDMKMALGGEEFEIQKKYSLPGVLRQTPIIMTANKPLFPYIAHQDAIAVNNRCKQFNFTKIIGNNLIPPSHQICSCWIYDYYASQQPLLYQMYKTIMILNTGIPLKTIEENKENIQI